MTPRVCADCRRLVRRRAYLVFTSPLDGQGQLVCPDCHRLRKARS